MANKIVRLLALAALILSAANCRSVPDMRVAPAIPHALTEAEARAALAEGRDAYAQQPPTLDSMRVAAAKLGLAAQFFLDDFDAQWQAARAFSYLAENEPSAEMRADAARRGVTLARRATEIEPNRVEGHYWYAINVGLLGDADRNFGISAVNEMDAALKKAIELDENYDFAGPWRVLGLLQLRSPGPPVGVGSRRRALKSLQRAVELAPNYDENHLNLAEALAEDGKFDAAEEHLARVKDENLRKEASQIREKIAKLRSQSR
jgi:tetratricopeptide (TPR) repeat protein